MSEEIGRAGIAPTEARLAALAAPTNEELFALAGLRFLGGVEAALQLRWQTGVQADWSELPILRLPIPENPNARPFAPADFTALVTGLDADMDAARAALDQLGDKPFALEIRMVDLWFDINANGTRDGGEDIGTVTGMALPAGYIRTDADTVATFDGTFWVLDRQTERGSNANGEYLRLADGTQIAAAVITETSHAITTADGGQFRSSAVITVTYPAAFAANPVVVVSIRNPSGTTGLMHRVILPAATTADLSFGATASTTVATLRAAYVANGRWF